MGKYQAYEKYKDSGVEWLGDIPEHWDIWKVTHGFKNVGSGTTPKSDNPDFYDGDIPWITTSELRETLIADTSQKVTKDALKLHSALKLYPKGSIAIAMYGATIGRLGIFGVDATVNQACCVFSESKVFHLQFFYYWLWMHRPNLIALSSGGGQPNLSQDDLKQLRLPTPPLDEQGTIAAFLDHKTKQIDDLIAKKEALLEKLDEKRTALISHAVTKGLDPTVPMKYSGVEWLGDIPEHWEVIRFKHLTRQIIDGAHFTPTYVYDGIPFLRVTDIVQAKNESINMNNIKFIPEAEHKILSLRCKPEKGDLLYSKNGTIGIPRVIDWDFEFSIFVSLCLIKLIKHKIDVHFFQYSLLGKLTETQISIGAKSNTVTNLHLDKIKEFLATLPPLNEQKKINDYLDHKTAEIDLQKAKVREAIERLKEYRTALITNAVTGKIDVRQVSLN